MDVEFIDGVPIVPISKFKFFIEEVSIISQKFGSYLQIDYQGQKKVT